MDDNKFTPEPEPVGPSLDLYIIGAILIAIIIGALVTLSGCASGHDKWAAVSHHTGDVIRGN